MPTSDPNSIPAVVNAAIALQPRTVLDLGAGCGKYGVLLREYLDHAQGRLERLSWHVEIDAVEGFHEYVRPLHHEVYDNVYVLDFTRHYEQYRGYDLVLMVDSLEHVEMELGAKILTHLIRNNKHVIVSCPFGDNYLEQGAVNGNEMERHRAHWTPETFQSLGGTKLYEGVCAVYRFDKF